MGMNITAHTHIFVCADLYVFATCFATCLCSWYHVISLTIALVWYVITSSDTRTQTWTCARTHPHTHTHTRTPYAHMHICSRSVAKCTCVHAYWYTCVRTYMLTCVNCSHESVHGCLDAGMHMWITSWNIHACTHISKGEHATESLHEECTRLAETRLAQHTLITTN